MKTKKLQERGNRFLRAFLSFMLLVNLTGFASVAGATYSLPASRSITWTANVGVLNDIPARTTIYTTLSPVSGDNSTAIQTAINNCPSGQVVKLNAGTYSIGKATTLKSGVTLRGAGMGATILKGASGMTGSYFIGLYNSTFLGTSINISASGSMNIGFLSHHLPTSC